MAIKRGIGLALVAVAAMAGGMSLSVTAQPGSAAAQSLAGPSVAQGDTCARLGALRLKDVTITIAAGVADGAPVPNSGLSPMFGNAAVVGKAPAAFCRVVGHIRPTPTSDIGFEVWLPSSG